MRKERKKHIRDLVLRMWNSDTDAFIQLYSMTCDSTYNYCMCILHEHNMTLRAVSEIYSYVYSHILHLTDPALFEAWLRRVAFQVCSDTLIGMGDPSMLSMISPYELEVLPFHERQILFLSDYRGMKDSDIADILDISKKEVENCLQNAKRRLLALQENDRF